jgi:hypothetical protein
MTNLSMVNKQLSYKTVSNLSMLDHKKQNNLVILSNQ